MQSVYERRPLEFVCIFSDAVSCYPRTTTNNCPHVASSLHTKLSYCQIYTLIRTNNGNRIHFITVSLSVLWFHCARGIVDRAMHWQCDSLPNSSHKIISLQKCDNKTHLPARVNYHRRNLTNHIKVYNTLINNKNNNYFIMLADAKCCLFLC